jgi:hypothetical protein
MRKSGAISIHMLDLLKIFDFGIFFIVFGEILESVKSRLGDFGDFRMMV